MKKFLIVLCLLLCICSFSYAMTRNVKCILNRRVIILYDGRMQEFHNVKSERVYPFTYEGTTYLPIRALSSLFNKKIRFY